MVLWTVKGEGGGRRDTEGCVRTMDVLSLRSLLCLQYNMSPLSGEVPKSRSLERKQQDPIVLTKWRHSTYVLDLNDKVRL